MGAVVTRCYHVWCSVDLVKYQDKTELDGQVAHAFQAGVEVATGGFNELSKEQSLTYRGAASAAIKKAESTNDAVEVMRAASRGAKAACGWSTRDASSLKEVGVVDSGGQGFVVFIY